MSLPPIRRQIVVPAGVEDAFEVFTDEIGEWWPVADGYSVFAGYVALRDVVVERAPGTAAPEGSVWLALLHTPGPAVARPLDVFAHPGFGEHVAFLRRLLERGVLVAAGPFPATGCGLAVLHLTNPGEAAEYVRLAQEDDGSVVRGVLQVDVRPWSVMFTAPAD